MSKLTPLAPEALCTRCDPEQFTFETTADLEDLDGSVGQERALDSVQFGIRIRSGGYNVFALGPSGLGKFTAVRQAIERDAATQEIPPDWCYVNNFQHPHKPKALKLPPGTGAKLRRDMEQLLEELSSAIPAAFDSDEYHSRIGELEEEFKERQANALNELRERAQTQGVALVNTPTGFAFTPKGKDDEVLSPDEFEKLSKEEQERIQNTVSELQDKLQKILRMFPVWRRESREKVKALNQEVARFAATHLIDDLREQYKELSEVLSYLDAVEQDIIEHVDDFHGERESPLPFLAPAQRTAPLQRYVVNLLVDHSDEKAAPVVYEDLPNHHNLIGRVEHQAQMGTLVTDFTLIKPGALHRANGGYLIIDALKVLKQPFAWESLKRALQSHEIRIESLERMLSLISTVSLEPEPIPLDVKVILVGERFLYYLLYHYDPEFQDLFKVGADFEETMTRNNGGHMLYARFLASIVKREDLRPLDRSAVVRTIEHSARTVEDAEKLSTHLRGATDLLREADYWAKEAHRNTITAEDVQHAVDKQIHRADRIRERVYEEIHRGTILIDTQEKVIGQINGLSVIDLGNFAFGRPSRITATTRIGEGEVIDIERETELGGAIHSKGVFILSNFLASRYAMGHPLSISASLVFEQSYGFVEGDSASLAELCAMISALAELPIQQCLAVTGSVNQLGKVQPIGGVNEKIEGFFDVCSATGLTGTQGVLIPATNVRHLMLRQDVVDAAKAGQFQTYAVETVDQAIELLTGESAGERDPSGKYPENSVNARVEEKLVKFATTREHFGKESKSDKGSEEDD